MLTIEEIKKALDSGKEVELECIDQEAYWKNAFRPDHYNSFLLSGRIVVRGIDKFGVDIIGSKIGINSKDLKYFSIKRSTPTFDDLIDQAAQAVKDDVLLGFMIENTGPRYLRYWTHDFKIDNSIYGKHDDYSDGIDFIKSLYTETFVIESEDDIKNIKKAAIIRLQNGNEICAESNCLSHNINFIQTTYGGSNFHLSFISLKGATITQKRGAA